MPNDEARDGPAGQPVDDGAIISGQSDEGRGVRAEVGDAAETADRLDREAAEARMEAQKAAAAALEARAATLFDKIEAHPSSLDRSGQARLAHLVTLIPDVLASGDVYMLRLLELGTAALLREPPEPQLAQRVEEDLRRRLLNPVRYVVFGLGMAFLTLVVVPFLYLIANPPPRATATSDGVLVQAVRDIRDLQAAFAASQPVAATASPSIGPSPSSLPSPSSSPSQSPTAPPSPLATELFFDDASPVAPFPSPAAFPTSMELPTPVPTTSASPGPMTSPLISPSPSARDETSAGPPSLQAAPPGDSSAAAAIGALLAQTQPEAAACRPNECFLGLPIELIALVTIFGAAGALASIFVRIRSFARVRRRSAIEMFLVGFTRPILGILFALFLFTVISAGLVPLLVQEPSYFWAAVAFVAGFSERLAPDVVGRTEATILSANGASGGRVEQG